MARPWSTGKPLGTRRSRRECRSHTFQYAWRGDSTVDVSVIWAGGSETKAVTMVADSVVGVTFQDETLFNINVVAWYWDFGDGTNIYEQNPTHEYPGGCRRGGREGAEEGGLIMCHSNDVEKT